MVCGPTTLKWVLPTKKTLFFLSVGGTLKRLVKRLTIAETIDGTRSYHCFQLNGETKLELYTLSADEIFVFKNLHGSKGLFVDIDCLKIGLYVAASIRVNGTQVLGSKRPVS